MDYKDLIGYNYNQGVVLGAKIPIDLRTVADTYNDLATLPKSWTYEGL